MGIKISERVKLHHIEWDEVNEELLLKEYAPTTWNTGTTEYNIELTDSYKLAGADYADLYDNTSNTVTTIASSGVYYKVGMNAVSSASKGFTLLSNGRITKDGGDAYKNPIRFQASITFQGTNNDQIYISFYKNGYETRGRGGTTIKGTGKPTTMTIQCLETLDDGDYMELYIKNETSSNNLTLEYVNIIANEIT